MDRQDPNKFVNPVGGHIKSGENHIDALKRETLEKTKVYGFKYKFIKKIHFEREIIGNKENHLFLFMKFTQIGNQDLTKKQQILKNLAKESCKNL